MKKIFSIIFILVFVVASCVTLFACDAESNKNKPVSLREGMRAEDIFDLLDRAFSYSVKVDGEDYRFVRGKGYTKLENGVFDGLVTEDGKVFRMTTKDGTKVLQEPLDEKFYSEVDDVYDKYVKLLRDSFENMSSSEPVEFTLGDGGYRATIKIILRKSAGEFSVSTCEISNINSTVLFFPDELKDFAELANNA